MKKIDPVQLIQVIANFGVIAGIVFLAVELQQNNALLEAQARATRAQVRIDAYDHAVNNPALLGAQLEALSELDRLMLRASAEAMLTRWQYVFGEWRAELIDEDDVPTGNWRYAFERNAAAQEVWRELGKSAIGRTSFDGWKKMLSNRRVLVGRRRPDTEFELGTQTSARLCY